MFLEERYRENILSRDIFVKFIRDWYLNDIHISIISYYIIVYFIHLAFTNFLVNFMAKFTKVSLFFLELAILFRFRTHVSVSYRGEDRRTSGKNARARWKNVLTAYARLEIGERLCKTWLAHFKCRNAKSHRHSRIVLLSRDGSPPPPPPPSLRVRVLAVCRNIYIRRKFVSSDLDYGTSCFAESSTSLVETKILFRKERFLTWHRYDIVTIL